jgi:hypothetical protein
MSPSFYFKKKLLHRLNQSNATRDRGIQIQDQVFFFSEHQLAFLAPEAFYHFNESNYPFEIVLPLDSGTFSGSDILDSFTGLYSLFQSEAKLIINQINLPSLKYLSQVLGNSFLLDKCLQFSPECETEFSIPSKHLSLFQTEISFL